MKLEQELVILGLLWEKPRHGYEIKKQINEFLNYFTALEYESIYYSLVCLEKKGLVKKTIASGKSRPDKNIYSLTQKGKERFSHLLNRSFLHIQRPYFGIDLSLFFLPHLKSEESCRRLKARMSLLKKIEHNLFKIYPDFQEKNMPHLLAILEHNSALIKAELNFISSLINQIKEGKFK